MTNIKSRFPQTWRDDTGSAGMSTFVVTISFIMLLGLGVAGMRTFIGASDLQAAAQAGARAAALEHTFGEATASATRVINDEVTRSGFACQNTTIAVSGGPGGFGPGGSVVVDLQCTVSYADVWVPGLGGSRVVTASATEPMDCLLGGGNAQVSDNCYFGG